MSLGAGPGDTIFALSSGRPPAAIAIIRLSGPRAHEAARRLCGDLPDERRAALRTLTDPDSGDRLDEALVIRFDAPESATAEDVVELHCHGGRAVVDAVLGALGQIDGLREAKPGEFTRRAFENGRIDLTEAEGLADLLEAETESQRKAAVSRAEGGLRRQVERWSERVLQLSAQAERAIDFADEDSGDAETSVAAEAGVLAEELGEWLDRPRVEPLRDGVRVVAAGPPNSGKSSLINAIAGTDRIIVSPIPGTTRDVVEVPIALGGIPFVFADTAGLRETGDSVESIGIERAGAEIGRADILLWLGAEEDRPGHARAIQLSPKADLETGARRQGLAVSALTGVGLSKLVEGLRELAQTLLPADGAVALNRRQAEAIGDARLALLDAAADTDPAIQAESLRSARAAFDRCTGRAGVEQLLDALYSRFCLGK